ncbi:MAG TPA: Hsp20 family protein [Candidatus Limnocylindrales bacterium]|nr:Hsp20 family protein [Candidatus Limnocylindrales bacterium]
MKEQLLSKNHDLKMGERPPFVDFEKLSDHVQELHDSITRRAYELFEHNGYSHGRDLDHWLDAEKEMLHPLPVELTETDDTLTLRAEVPGFRAEDLELSVEPRRLAISGKRETREETKSRRTIYHEHLSNQICRSVELPIEVDPSRADATIRDGVLELSMPKAPRARQLRVAGRVA